MNLKSIKEIASYFKYFIKNAIPIIIIIIAWQLLFNDSVLFPSPLKVMIAFWEWINSGVFYEDLKNSIWRQIFGFTTGTFIGIIMGFLTGRLYRLNQFLSPIMNILRAFPPVALLPIFITFWGIGDFSKILSIAFACIFPVWINTHISSSSIPIEFIRCAKLFNISFFRMIYPATFFYLALPSCLHNIFAGVRINIALSFIMLYVSELVGASTGIGYQISSAHLSYRMDLMLAALLFLGFCAAFVDICFVIIIKIYFPWFKIKL